ncbi:MAG: ABC transporter permease [Vulcanimicrobiaceae bacterium]
MTRIVSYAVEALESLWRNRTRSALSMLGMIIGIASVIGVLGLSQAASGGIREQIDQGGDPGIIVAVDQSQDDPSIATLYYRDASLMQGLASDTIREAIPFYNGPYYRVRASKKSTFVSFTSTKELEPNQGLVVNSGRLIDRNDVASGANVCILSKSAADNLFPGVDPVGQSINVGSTRVQIVGVVSSTGSLFNSLTGDQAYAPYTTMHRIAPGPIDFIQFWPVDKSRTRDAMDAARSALQHIHGAHAQYTVQDQASTLGLFTKILSIVGLGLTVIGGIALFVAGVGIMNIMLVSVTERTREIGIRKSIGANAGDIGLQFLIEATLLSLFGGAIGAIAGILIVLAGANVIEASFGAAPIPWGLVIGIAVGFSMLVGIGFGSYPALRAGRLDPVEALRS